MTSHAGVSAPFQSTHPRGVRQHLRWHYRRYGTISIHAPSWGATMKKMARMVVDGISIHAPSWGATSISPSFLLSFLFQSTHPRGVRLSSVFCMAILIRISIHAPSWGATEHNYQGVIKAKISIHAPSWGATGCLQFLFLH